MATESAARIRLARPADAGAVRDIYAPFCESSPVTFEERPPTEAEMADRIASTLERYPWLVCEVDGEDGAGGRVVGYAAASRLRPQRAFEWAVELSVYVADAARRSGVGRALYDSLFAVLERQGFRDAYAVTTVPNPETVRFHERMGFERIADFPRVGYTEGAWYDVAWWRRPIAEKGTAPERPRPVPEVVDDPDWESLVAAGDDRLERV